MFANLGSRKIQGKNLCRMVQGHAGLPRHSLPHHALPMLKRCRHVWTAGKGQTGAPCPIERAAADSIPPGLEFGGGAGVEKTELKTSQTHSVYYGSIGMLSSWCSRGWAGHWHVMLMHVYCTHLYTCIRAPYIHCSKWRQNMAKVKGQEMALR